MVTQRLARLLDEAESESARLKDKYVPVEHMLMSLLEEGRDAGCESRRGLSAGGAAGPGSHGSAPARRRLFVLVKRVQAEPLMLG